MIECESKFLPKNYFYILDNHDKLIGMIKKDITSYELASFFRCMWSKNKCDYYTQEVLEKAFKYVQMSNNMFNKL